MVKGREREKREERSIFKGAFSDVTTHTWYAPHTHIHTQTENALRTIAGGVVSVFKCVCVCIKLKSRQPFQRPDY